MKTKEIVAPLLKCIFQQSNICLGGSQIYVYRSRDADMNRPIARELANIFESIRSFAAEEPLFPQEIRNPPLNEWSLRQTMDPSLFVLHPRCAKDYIMAVYREIKKQQAKQKRDMTAIAEKFKV